MYLFQKPPKARSTKSKTEGAYTFFLVVIRFSIYHKLFY